MIVTKMTTETLILLYSHLAIEMGSQGDSLCFSAVIKLQLVSP